MDEDMMIPLVQKQSRIKVHQEVFTEYLIRIWEDIGNPSEWVEELDTIRSASENDVVVLDICSDGGSLDTAMMFHRELAASNAKTIAIIGPSCSSAASIIALSCDEHVISEMSSLMSHTSTYLIGGKDVDIHTHAMFSRKQLVKFFKSVYSGFFDDTEIEDMVKGSPFYIDSEELEQRLERMYTYREQPITVVDELHEPVDTSCLIDSCDEVFETVQH